MPRLRCAIVKKEKEFGINKSAKVTGHLRNLMLPRRYAAVVTCCAS